MNAFVVANRQIVSEIIDGEAVILDLNCGSYYTTDGVGAEIWRGASAGMRRDDIHASCLAHFPDQPSMADDLDALLRHFVESGLLVVQNPPVPSDTPVLEWPREYRTPTLEGFDDLADMMALDPVHEVDAAAGWPAPRKP